MTNPFLSMWLSAANSWAGAARGFWTAELYRQQRQMMNELTKQMVSFWLGSWPTYASGDKPTSRRSR